MYQYYYSGSMYNWLFARALLHPYYFVYVYFSCLVCHLPLLCRYHSIYLPLPQFQHQNRVQNIHLANCVPNRRVLLCLRATANSILQVLWLHLRRGHKPTYSFCHSSESKQQTSSSLNLDCAISHAVFPPLSLLNPDLIYACVWKHTLYF